jgi:predicted sulfurtransferase
MNNNNNNKNHTTYKQVLEELIEQQSCYNCKKPITNKYPKLYYYKYKRYVTCCNYSCAYELGDKFREKQY